MRRRTTNAVRSIRKIAQHEGLPWLLVAGDEVNAKVALHHVIVLAAVGHAFQCRLLLERSMFGLNELLGLGPLH